MDISTSTDTVADTDTDRAGRTRTSRRRTLTLLIAMLALTVFGVAFANWLATGEGTGEVQAGQSEELIITVTPDETLYPGVSSDLEVQVDNQDNPFDVAVTEIDHTGTTVAGGGSGCTAGDVTVSADETFTAGDHVAAAGGDVTITLGDAVTMEIDADNDCQDATFSVTLVVTAESYA